MSTAPYEDFKTRVLHAGKETAPISSRLTTPTTKVLEPKRANLEFGAGAMVMGSGMAAV